MTGFKLGYTAAERNKQVYFSVKSNLGFMKDQASFSSSKSRNSAMLLIYWFYNSLTQPFYTGYSVSTMPFRFGKCKHVGKYSALGTGVRRSD